MSRLSPWSKDIGQGCFEPIFAVVSRAHGLSPRPDWRLRTPHSRRERFIQGEEDLKHTVFEVALTPVEISWFANRKPWLKGPKGCIVNIKILLRNNSRNTYCFTKVYLIGQIYITFQGVQLTFNFTICYDIILCLEEIFKDLFSPCSVEKVLLINNLTLTRWSYYERAFQKGSLRNISAA